MLPKVSPEEVKWSAVAYNLATAVIELMLDGKDGPPQYGRCHPPCDCLVHSALEDWGNMHQDFLDKVSPNPRYKYDE